MVDTDRLLTARTVGSLRVVNRVQELVRLCRGKRVLHLGCADFPFTPQLDGRLLHGRLAQVASELWGVDKSAEGIAHLRQRGFGNLVTEDVECLKADAVPGAFDVIIAGELLEHLDNPGRFLNAVRALMRPHTELVLTTPNASSIRGLIHSARGCEKVHEEHRYYFSYFTIRQLLGRAGFSVREIGYYQEVNGCGLRRLLDRGLALVPQLWPMLADGLIVRATRADEGNGYG